MSVITDQAIAEVISRAVENGEILRVSKLARQIAEARGEEPGAVADSLIAAGIKAGIPMELGAREDSADK